MTVHHTPQGLLLASRFTWVKASCLCLYPDPVVAQPVGPVAWPRVSVQPAAAPAVPVVAVVAVRVVAAAVAAAPACVVAAAVAAALACVVAAVVAAAPGCVVAAAVAELREAVPVLHAFPVLSAANQYAAKLAPLYAVPAAHVVAA